MGKYLDTGTKEALDRAETAFRRALELNPELTMAHKLYAQLEVDLGRAPEAMARLLERAHTADPELLAGLVSACRYCGLLDASVAAHRRAVALEPKIRTSIPHTWFMQADHAKVATIKIAEFPYIVPLSLAELGRESEAVPILKELEPRIPTRLRDFIVAARTLLEGQIAESIAAVNRVASSGFGDPEGLFYLSRHMAHLKEAGPALDLFERVVAGGFVCFPIMARDPWLDPIRKKPAFAKLLRQAETRHQEAGAIFDRLDGNRMLGGVR